ncbi:hypothetical protein GIB67_012189 [Kingdonia uniflora]|uniref:Ubiquinol oxidase n=1 Tax=Kingdonia uniflora TaxID=39325 RepID=A0A7J7NNL5_9MAGN|nr:hypothetical protein GIB67_012189 [Kingdonia uniflora]
MDFFNVKKFRKAHKPNVERDLGDEQVVLTEEVKIENNKVDYKIEVKEEEDDDDFIEQGVKRRLKELRNKSGMSLMLLKEDEEGRSSSDWRGSEIEDHEPPCHGFDELYENYCERMLFFDQRRYGCRAMMLETVAAVPAYLASPKLAHRVVGYLEEEAIHSNTEFLKELDKGKIENVPAPAIVIDFWRLSADSTLRDVIMVVKADEAHHRDANHFASDIHFQGHELRESPVPLGYH